MNPSRPLFLLLTCVLMAASGTLHAQPRAQDPPELPENWQRMYENGRLSDEEGRSADPCPRPERDLRYVLTSTLHARRKGARIAICVGRVRSQAAELAWKNGLDEHGLPLEADAGAKKLSEMELWLRRLVGKYRVEGEYANTGGSSPVRGATNCVAVGAGPGVSCTIRATWKVPKEGRKDPAFDKELYSGMQPLVVLLGIDPGASQIRVTLVDFRAMKMSGLLLDGTLIFDRRTPPPAFLQTDTLINYHNVYTWGPGRIDARPRGDFDLKLVVRDVEFDLQLHRESSSNATTSKKAP